jgi:hypothetical protein
MPFTDDDVVVKQTSDEQWEVVEPLIYEGNQDAFLVQAGFSTDLASVPRPVVWLLPRYGRYTKAAILHDYLCHEARTGLFNRNDADGIFRRAMRELEVSFARRWMMWAAVRIGSGKELLSPGVGQLLLVLLIALLSLALVVVPAVAILAAITIFWLVELLFFLVLRPFSKREKVNKPQFAWKLSS